MLRDLLCRIMLAMVLMEEGFAWRKKIRVGQVEESIALASSIRL